METQKSSSGAVIATIAAALLCGCPGLLSVCLGATSAVASFIPSADIDIYGSSDPSSALLYGGALLCGGIIFIAIPVVIGVVTLRKKKAPSDKGTDKGAVKGSIPPDEPLPPPS